MMCTILYNSQQNVLIFRVAFPVGYRQDLKHDLEYGLKSQH